jgi:putative ABC transport system permease protein
MHTLLDDFVYSIRRLGKNLGFLAVSVITLAVGIGANTTVFNAVEAVLLRPLPFHDPDRIVMIREASDRNRSETRNPTLATTLDWKKAAHSFEQFEMAVWYFEAGNLAYDEDTQNVRIEYVAPGLLNLLGVRPQLGRSFEANDSLLAGETPSILISHALWLRSFAANPRVVGRTVRLAGRPVAIVGVLPSGTWVFPARSDPDVWAVIDPTHTNLTAETRYLTILARLKADVTVEKAQAEMNVLANRLTQDSGQTNKGWSVRVDRIHDIYFGHWKGELYLLFGVVACVLLIACANAASLLLARGLGRQKEFAIRLSLGGSRFDLVRQLLMESIIVGALAALLGTMLAIWGFKILLALEPYWFPQHNNVQLDSTVIAFTLALSILTVLIFGLVPAFLSSRVDSSRVDVNRTLKQVGRTGSGGSRRLRRLLVVGEFALTLVLLMGAGLLINSFLRLQNVDPGFRIKGLLLTGMELLDQKHVQELPHDQKQVSPLVDEFYREVLERIQAVPGVEAAAMAGMSRQSPVRVIGHSGDLSAEAMEATYYAVSNDYFRTMQQTMMRGRGFEAGDTSSSSWVAVASETAARRLFGREDPIGKTIQFSFRALSPGEFPEARPRVIVGVVRDAKLFGFAEDPEAFVYVPNSQHNQVYPGGAMRTHISREILVRTNLEPLSFEETLRKIVAKVDHDQTVDTVMTMEQVFGNSLSNWTFFLRVFSIFAGIAVFLAAVGIYGLVSDSVQQRTHEIGIRVALGARRAQVVTLILSETLQLTAFGLLLGAGGVVWLRHLVEHLLWGVKSADPATLASVSILLALLALGDSTIPVRRALAVDPAKALRDEYAAARTGICKPVSSLHSGIPFFRPFRGFLRNLVVTHGLRRGLYSFAASRLAPISITKKSRLLAQPAFV